MAKAIATPTLDLNVRFEINLVEARALDGLAGYGDDAFIKVFYEKLGKAYMQEHEQGLREFLKTIRSVVGPAIRKIDDVERILKREAKEELARTRPKMKVA